MKRVKDVMEQLEVRAVIERVKNASTHRARFWPTRLQGPTARTCIHNVRLSRPCRQPRFTDSCIQSHRRREISFVRPFHGLGHEAAYKGDKR